MNRYYLSLYLHTWLLLSLFSLLEVNAGTKAMLDPIPYEGNDEDRSIGFSYGLNLGAYFANNATANYYNGSGRNDLEQAIMRQHNYNRIRESLGYDFELHELPSNMSYSPAMLVGVFGTLHFNPRTSLHAEFNYARIRLQDQFTLRIMRGDPGLIGHDIERYNILGTEERSDIRIGIQQTYLSKNRPVHPFIEAGVNMINTKARENRVQIAGISYSILNLTDTRYGFRDDGISFGAYTGSGIRMDIGESYALALGAHANFANINLGENNKYNLHYSIFVRLFLSAGTEITTAD